MTRHGQVETAIYHNNGRSNDMRNELNGARAVLRMEYAKRLAIYEIELMNGLRPIDDNELNKIRTYSMSTPLRRRFMMHTIVAAVDDKHVGVSNTKKLLGTSRASMDTMVNECVAAGWVRIERDCRNHRSIQATEIVIECWLGYADYVTHLANKYNLNYLSNSQARISELLENK